MVENYHIKGLKSKLYIGRWLPCLAVMLLSIFGVRTINAATITYTYDNLNRLNGVNYGGEASITYSYDAAGNRLTLVSTDPTPPTTPTVTDDGLYITDLTQLHAVWTSEDPESGIAEYQYAIGTAPEGADIIGWTSAGIDNSITQTGLNLIDGVTYYISVKARNVFGRWSEIGSSDGILALSPAGDYDGDGLPQPITYQWSLVSIPAGSILTNADIVNSDTVSASFIPHIAGSYVLKLAVSDGMYISPENPSNPPLPPFSKGGMGGLLSSSFVSRRDMKVSFDNVVVEVDGDFPHGSVIINSGAVWTNTAAVTLTLDCTDSESGCIEMRFSNNNIN